MKSSKNSKNVLVIAAHPDDEILGCGGTIARLSKEGHEIYSLILAEGITSRDPQRNRPGRKKEIKHLKASMHKANKIAGTREVFDFDYPDNRFDTVPFLDIVKTIEDICGRVKPNIIFTHHKNDLNIDHQITCKAVMTATRPQPGDRIQEVYAFEVLSSTEWSFPLSFSPNVYFDIGSSFKLKCKAMKAYETELREYPHPRSLEGIEANARLWGMKSGLKLAEAFELIRAAK